MVFIKPSTLTWFTADVIQKIGFIVSITSSLVFYVFINQIYLGSDIPSWVPSIEKGGFLSESLFPGFKSMWEILKFDGLLVFCFFL